MRIRIIIKNENYNYNKLFALFIGIRIKMSCIAVNVFSLSYNRNQLLQVIKMTLVDYYKYLL